MSKNLKELVSEHKKNFGRYLIVGFSSAAIELSLFWVLYELLGLRTIVSPLGITILISNVIALTTATAFNFIMSYTWTFNTTSHPARAIILYLLLFLFNQVFSNMAIVFMLGVGVSSLLAKVITMACIVCWNFMLYRFVVFK